MNKKTIIMLIFIIINIFVIILCSINIAIIYDDKSNMSNNNENKVNNIEVTTTKLIDENITNISINAIGDCTIGYDENFGYSKSFNEVYEINGNDYFFSNVKEIFDNDDITVANLEGTFTNATIKREKKFNFKAPPHYVEVLNSGSIELVNIANNHIYDYNEVGYNHTISTLINAGIDYFGFEKTYIYKKDDISIGFAGIYCIEDMSCTKKIDSAISNLKEENVTSIVLSFHWGIEKSYKQSSIQTYLAHYAIDNGVELVLGHHPHVLQGIELYKDKYIVYSLANFSFGGNKNPSDKDTMIFNINFKYLDGVLNDFNVNIYPVSVSSVNYINDYKPTLLEGDEYNRVMKKIEKNSIGLSLT